MKIKNTKTDKVFSLAIREAYNWTCQCCGKQSPNNEYGFIDAAHCFSRRHRFTRWYPVNVAALCRACHLKQTNEPDLHVTFWKQFLGEDYGNMRELKNSLHKVTKKDEEAIHKHYKAELERIKELRMNGKVGPIELEIPGELL